MAPGFEVSAPISEFGSSVNHLPLKLQLFQSFMLFMFFLLRLLRNRHSSGVVDRHATATTESMVVGT